MKVVHIPQLSELQYINFWSKATLTANPDICWDWNGYIREKKKPYGRYEINGKVYSAHRVAYFIQYKIDPKELHCLHHCDNPRCVNPSHLFLGTNADNVADKVKKGRQVKNQKHNSGRKFTQFHNWKNPGSKLSEKQYGEILEKYMSRTHNAYELAELYQVSRTTIMKVVIKMGGDKLPTNILSKEQVLEIRNKFNSGKHRICELAKEYNIGAKTISDIGRNLTWKNI